MAVPTLTALATLYADLDNGFGPAGATGTAGTANTTTPTNGNPGANSSTPGAAGATGDVAPTSNSFPGNPGLNGLATPAPFNGLSGLPGVAGTDRVIPVYYWSNSFPFAAGTVLSSGITSSVVGNVISLTTPAAAVPASYLVYASGCTSMTITDPNTGGVTSQTLLSGFGNIFPLWLAPSTTIAITSAGGTNASITMYTI